jgi:hypothetical protein
MGEEFKKGDVVRLNTNRDLCPYQTSLRYTVLSSQEGIVDLQVLDEENPYIYRGINNDLLELDVSAEHRLDPRISVEELEGRRKNLGKFNENGITDQQQDDINDVSIVITNRLIDLGYVPDCEDTDNESEFEVQDTIREVLIENLKSKR